MTATFFRCRDCFVDDTEVDLALLCEEENITYLGK